MENGCDADSFICPHLQLTQCSAAGEKNIFQAELFMWCTHKQANTYTHARKKNKKSKMHSCSIQMLFLKLIYCVVCQRHFSWFHQVDVVLRLFRDRGKTHMHARACTNYLWNELVINNVKTRPNYLLIKEFCSYAYVFHGGMKAVSYCGIQGAMTLLTLLLKQTAVLLIRVRINLFQCSLVSVMLLSLLPSLSNVQ